MCPQNSSSLSMITQLDGAASIEDVIARLKSINGPITVGIDGFNGTRKSNLSYRLGYELLAEVVGVDNFIKPDSGTSWRSFINHELLSRRINILRGYGNGRVVVEGICLLEILDTVHIKPDVLIYAQEVDQVMSWKYQNIEDGQEYQRLLSLASSNVVQVDVLKYHKKYLPWKRAGYIHRFVR